MTQPDASFKARDLSPWVFTLTGADGNPVNLAGLTVNMHMVRAVSDRPLIFDLPTTVDPDQVNNKGKVSYPTRAQDVAVPGDYLAEFYETTGKLTYPNDRSLLIRLKADLA